MKGKISTILLWIFFVILCTLSVAVRGLSDWFNMRFGVSFEEILFTITSPMTGSDTSFFDEAVAYVLPIIKSTLIAVALILPIIVVLRLFFIGINIRLGKKRICLDLYQIFKLVCFLVVFFSLYKSINYAVDSLGLREYIANKKDKTTIYEDYYVDPNEVAITNNNEPKNLIYIYMESMETTYASKKEGGYQEINYIPNLTQMAYDNISFSDGERLGGARLTAGSTWTMGALFSITSGVPFSLPIDGNAMSNFENFTPGITALGDILEEKGYQQFFLCGSDGTFGGRQNYFEQHGNYNVIDYYDAIAKGYIDENYYVWWGYEDLKLYDIAKKELLELSAQDKPFNFTMLTVDTHHVNGYVCENCKSTYPEQLGNVLECADNQIYDFINWCKEQEFYDDTVIVITGDHFRMDTSLIPQESERRLYNCFINSEVQPQGDINYRQFTSMDIFPTTLAAMGFEIEGNRLGLGTNLLSQRATLTEELGFDVLNLELSKYSPFYEEKFQ